jgi:squalene-hopene/tetraprenyl-beta-curcumene cyclase
MRLTVLLLFTFTVLSWVSLACQQADRAAAVAAPASVAAGADEQAPAPAAPVARPAPLALRTSLDRGVEWLRTNQNPDGGFGPYGEKEGLRLKNASDVGITAFALYALARHPRGYKPEPGTFLARAADYLLSKQQPDGGFYDTRDPTLQNYKTSVVVLALTQLDRLKYADAIARAQAFIKKQQWNAEDGYTEGKSPGFGGIGYGSKQDQGPDMSNTNLGGDALVASGLSGSDELWAQLVVFVSRCQNSPTVDPLLQELRIGTTGDGGFRYAPAQTRGPEESIDGVKIFSSYGSMTYAGLKSLLYANVKKSDPRVQQAFAWISRNFTVKENPGMATRTNPGNGLHGLYYYYYTMAKALSVYGEPIIRDDKGISHRWAQELGEHLAGVQNEDGRWQNTSDRWYENIAALDTSYAIVALSLCVEELQRPPPASGAAQEK